MQDTQPSVPLPPAFNRRRLLAGSAALAAAISVGCGDDDAVETLGPPPSTPTASVTPTAPVAGGTLRTLGGALGPLPDPHKTRSPAEALIWQGIGNLLFRYGAAEPYAVEPDLAATLPETPGDGVTLIVKLRPEATWQNRAPVNGRTVTADDVKLTFERIKALGAKSPRAGNYTGIDSITAVDATTLRFKLKSPQADLLNVMADQFDIILPKELTARGDDAITGVAGAIGSGPYELQTYDTARKAQLQRRADGYWRPNSAWVDTWEILDVRDDGQKANGLLAGQGDIAELPPVLARVFDGRADFSVARTVAASRDCLLVNHGAARWKDPRVRLAASRAIDRTQLYAAAYESQGVPGGPMTPAAKLWALPDASLRALPGYGDRATDVAEAKKLMAAASLADGFDDTIITVASLKLDAVANAIASQLAEIGIRLKVQSVGDDISALTELARTGQFNLMATVVLAGIYPDAQLYLYHRTGASANYGKFTSPALDTKLERQRGLYDPTQRVALVREIQQDIINAPGPIWLGSRIVPTVTSARLHGATAAPFAAGYALAENAWLT